MYLSSYSSRDSSLREANDGWPSGGNLLQNYLPSDGDYLLTDLDFMALTLLSLMDWRNHLFHYKKEKKKEQENLNNLIVVVLIETLSNSTLDFCKWVLAST